MKTYEHAEYTREEQEAAITLMQGMVANFKQKRDEAEQQFQGLQAAYLAMRHSLELLVQDYDKDQDRQQRRGSGGRRVRP